MKKILIAVLISTLLPITSFAEGLTIVGSQFFSLPANTIPHASLAAAGAKQVKLIKFDFTPAVQQRILSQIDKTKNKSFKAEGPSPISQVSLGMNDVPVLDQGAHGTCVTFAVTAALDAALGKKDYISQLCSLELGNFLSQHGYLPTGWDGTDNIALFEQIHQFGIVNKANQDKSLCAGIRNYPVENPNDIGNAMSVIDYHKLSENIFDKYNGIYWFPIFSLFQPNLLDKNGECILQDVKDALRNKERVVFGFFIDTKEPLVGKHNVPNDTWLLTPGIIIDVRNNMENLMGHEAIITGYDDNAIAYDQQGSPHRGLLTLRNSWGTSIPGGGDQYMSYDYFKAMSDEATRVVVHAAA